MELIDFSACKLDRRSDYGGSERKNAIIYQGERYMIKFSEKQTPKNDYATSYVNNVLSEYIGSHVVASTGMPAHETLLGFYRDEFVVACKNFLKPGETLHEFSWYLRNLYDSSDVRRTPVLSQIYDTIRDIEDLRQIQTQAINHYWDTFVLDALIGNFDRHAGNWGYVIGADDTMMPAPVYDCGSCLYSGLSVDAMQKVLSSELEIARRLYEYPRAALFIGDGKNKIGYYDMLSSGYDQHCSSALLRMFSKINIENILPIMDEIPCLPDDRRRFYKKMLEHRYEFIIRRAYIHVRDKNYDQEALKRIGVAGLKSDADILKEFEMAKEEIGVGD